MDSFVDKASLPDLKIVPGLERVQAVVDYFLNFPAGHALDGGMVRLVIILNSLGIETAISCEGYNQTHRGYAADTARPMGFPSLTFSNHGRSGFTLPVIPDFDADWLTLDEAAGFLEQLIKTFKEELGESDFDFNISPENYSRVRALKVVEVRNGGRVDQERYLAARHFLNRFCDFVEESFFVGIDLKGLLREAVDDIEPRWSDKKAIVDAAVDSGEIDGVRRRIIIQVRERQDNQVLALVAEYRDKLRLV